MAWTFGPLLREGYGHNVESTFIETRLESGPAHRKRFSSDQVNIITGSVFLADASAVQAFWTHWDGDANQGADWFDMPITTQGVSVTHEVRISSPKVSPYASGGWRASLNVETRERLTS